MTVVFSYGQFLRVLAMAMLGLNTEIGVAFVLGPGRTGFVVKREYGLVLAGLNLPRQGMAAAISSGWS